MRFMAMLRRQSLFSFPHQYVDGFNKNDSGTEDVLAQRGKVLSFSVTNLKMSKVEHLYTND